MKVLTQQAAVVQLPPLDRVDFCWTCPPPPQIYHYHSIPSALPRSSSSHARIMTCSFDSTVDDVDKKVLRRSTRNRTALLNQMISPAESMLQREAVSLRHVPRTVLVVEEIPWCDHTPPDNFFDDTDGSLHPHATIQVLEEFFDGIDDHVNDRKEVKDYIASKPGVSQSSCT